ncbi:4-hydroxyphenylpyruvate dioxygenase [Plasmopara halstedii]|uniref:4-hydroxyphenylpyruvate dioxygenase n=1 Tax=Plasmopara halstedii TaxID=4781 RepID=A0A0N7L4L3_PLAHL|nr:4-hydroxyphenylpyruvate dioxygenase [Plasmopara halstedii]CEG38995.1 4-hydroxyphenylpyruvate dioxygenase [Plasmopara halstedii]|eukprot:XP_024575364.1 4-hydroxyphenylpyruvate dioxygenase [Plasmopara halstedii]
MALKTDDIFQTRTEMQKRSHLEGFEFISRPNQVYYDQMPERIGDALAKEQYKQIEQLDLLVDKDDQGILLQIFTKPPGDRATVFFEIIERVDCMKDSSWSIGTGCGMRRVW